MESIDLTPFSSPNFDQKAWLNAYFASSPASGSQPQAGGGKTLSSGGGKTDQRRKALEESEQKASRLLTALQVDSHDTSRSLEDMITNALARLPRTAKDIEAMSAATQSVASDLGKIGDRMCATRTPNEHATNLQHLHHVNTKLRRCADALQSAAEVTTQVEEIEQMIAQMGAGGGSSSGHQPPLAEGGGGGTSIVDADQLAQQISSVEQKLTELQSIDPSYGVQLRAKVDRFESDLQRSLERECLEALKKEDTHRAPKLLATLRTIGRDTSVVDQYLSHVLNPRRAAFSKELNVATSSNIVHVLQHFYRSVQKLLQKEGTYYASLFPADPAAIKALQQRLLQRLFGEITGEVELKLSRCDDTEQFVKCFELTNGFCSTSLAEHTTATTAPSTSSSSAASSSTVVHDTVLKPYKGLLTSFLKKEEAHLMKLVNQGSSEGPKSFASIVEAIEQWAGRCHRYLPQQTFLQSKRCWDSAIESFATGMLQQCAIQGGGRGGQEGDHKAQLKGMLTFYHQCSPLAASIIALEERIDHLGPSSSSSSNPPVEGVEAPTTSAATAVSSSQLERGTQAMKVLQEKSQENVKKMLFDPLSHHLKQYKTLPLWSNTASAATPTPGGGGSGNALAQQQQHHDVIRELGENMMEMPNDLDALEESENSDHWIGLVAQLFVSQYQNIMKETIVPTLEQQLSKTSTETTGGPTGGGGKERVVVACQQLTEDVEYLTNALLMLVGEEGASLKEFQTVLEPVQRLKA